MEIKDIIVHQLLGTATQQELDLLQAWLEASPRHRQLYDRLMADESFSLRRERLGRIDDAQAWRRLSERIRRADGDRAVVRPLRPWMSVMMKVAAVVVLVCAVGWMAYRHSVTVNPVDCPSEVMAAMQRSEQIGKTAAALRIRRGGNARAAAAQTVRLSSNEALSAVLEDQADADAECELQTLHTTEYWMTLDDGTRVHLDYNSRLVFPSRFADDSRTVYLEGTAYFYVAKEKNRPFLVKTAHGTVKEYGTEFMVSTVSVAGATDVVLVRGSVSVMTADGREHMMVPGDRKVVDGHGVRLAQKVDTAPCVAWNEGKFMFDDCRMADLMNVISRWYGCRVEYGDESLKNVRLTGTFDRYGSVDDILKAVSAVAGVHVTLSHGDTIRVE